MPWNKVWSTSITISIFLQGAVAALHMVHCFHLAGFPKGLIGCVTGKGSEIGDFLTMHPGVNCIRYFFTSSAYPVLLFVHYSGVGLLFSLQ